MFSVITNLNAVINKYLDKLQGIKPGGKVYDGAMNKSADEILTASKERIHNRGQAADGSPIGQYSTTPIYVSSNKAPGETTGKTGKSAFANGKAHRSRYFSGGYKDYKTAIGRNDTGSVNLTLTGAMRDNYQVIKTSEGYGLGWNDEEISKRAAALEDKFGKKIWMLTEEERATLITGVKDKLDLQ